MRTKQNMLQMIAVGLCSLVILGGAAIFYVSQLRTAMETNILSYLQESALYNKKMVKEKIDGNMDTLISVAGMLKEDLHLDMESLAKKMRITCKENSFKRMGIIDLDGNAFTSDGQYYDASNEVFLHDVLQGETIFSDIMYDAIDGTEIVSYATPLYNEEGTLRYVLFASLATDAVAESVLLHDVNTTGFMAISDQEGNIILHPDNVQIDPDVRQLSQLVFKDDQIPDLHVSTSGIAQFQSTKGEERYMAYESLGINDWFILSVVPMRMVSDRVSDFTIAAAFTWLAVAIVFILIILYINANRIRNDKKIHNIVFYDQIVEHENYNQFCLDLQSIMDDRMQSRYVWLDLDFRDFKLLNELYGIELTNVLLKMIMRKIDDNCSKGEYCCRIGADRFAILWFHGNDQSISGRLEYLMDAIQQGIRSIQEDAQAILCVGIYHLNEDDMDIEKCANRAIYAKEALKRQGHGGYCFFSKEMYEQILTNNRLERRMEEALRNEEFKVYLQPKISLHDESIHHAEALVRWEEPTFGLMAPNRFIPLFEKDGLLESLDMYMLDHVCALLAQWSSDGGPLPHISLNISRVYMFKPHFVQKVKAIINKHHVPPYYIELEITESVMFDRSEELRSIVYELKDFGVQISMDDFGSGYSSLNMLKEIPIDVIKLDQAFFRSNFEDKERANIIIEGIVKLAKMLQVQTVAEGIEQAEEITFLKLIGCNLVQGYYYAKPMNIEDFILYMQQHSQ